MARLQILELPVEQHGDNTITPFVLVIDQAGEETVDTLNAPEEGGSPYETAIARLTSLTLAEQIGARAVLVFRETVGIPASEAGAHTDPPLRVGDFTDPEEVGRLVKERDEARQWARHGYEIGQRHCGWTDHGVAPDWLTEGWPPRFDSCEHLQKAADLEEAEAIRKRVANECKAALTDALGMDRTRDWDDIRNAAAGIRKQRDAQAETIERVRSLPSEPDLMDSRQERPDVWLKGYECGVFAARAAVRTRDEATSGTLGA